MKKAFIVSDIHGFFDEMMTSLHDAQFDINNPNHIFVSLGDLLDRGPQAKECLDFVNNLPADRKILVRGNHEDLMEEAIARGEFKSHDYHNKTDDTAYQLTGLNPSCATESEILEAVKNDIRWSTYIKSCVEYYENNNNVFVHGWIPVHISYGMFTDSMWPIENWREGTTRDWKDARWINGMEAWLNHVRVDGKTVWCGHYHSSWGNSYIHHDGVEYLDEVETMYIDEETGKLEPHVNNDPFVDDGIVCMDACTVLSKKVNCKVIEEFEE